ncbi:tyrosine-type recombinase/integrase [Brunnivagina elsteri]|uniref:Site-specific integrase n=1 Tax=Brunnivagina elsteri CCALA 953 TaxID=987040 RepID=A0A2A2TN88_9CYAN|nr:tyrosine-type recombinase/integrase [Calothrix elsteri]PAX59877.1 site-specific integrase [Calothrix elsteri CCALA 953]
MHVQRVIKKVTIVAYKNRWRLRLPRGFTCGEQVYIYSGLEATAYNLRRVQSVALVIESDAESGCFDQTLQIYKDALSDLHTNQRRIRQKVKSLDLVELWDKYCDFKQSQLANTTFTKDFQNRYKNIINALPSKDLGSAIVIRDYLVANYSPKTTKRLLMQINACCVWGLKSGLITKNPFTDLGSDIKVKRWDTSKIDPFTAQERDAIISAFESDTLYKGYADFVKFLFFSGCRIGEAIALKWEHINADCTEITFRESYSHLYGRKSTKTDEFRRFPCNEQLKTLLLNRRTQEYNKNWLVFPSHTDHKEIKISGFTRIWRGYDNRGEFIPGIVTSLVEKGLVQRYRVPYNARHSFITMCLSKGIPVQTVASWVGNSPEVIYKHYAGITPNTKVPNL